MNLEFIAEIWEVITQYMNENDRVDAADSLVDLLIDNDYQIEDIKETFRGHREVLSSISDHTDYSDIENEYEDYDDNEEEDYYE